MQGNKRLECQWMINYWRSKRSCSKLRLRRAFDWLERWHFQQPPQVREGYRSLVGVLVDRRWGEERDVCVLKKKIRVHFRQCFFWKLTYKSFETSLSILSGLAALIVVIVARKTLRNRILIKCICSKVEKSVVARGKVVDGAKRPSEMWRRSFETEDWDVRCRRNREGKESIDFADFTLEPSQKSSFAGTPGV